MPERTGRLCSDMNNRRKESGMSRSSPRLLDTLRSNAFRLRRKKLKRK